MWWSSRLRHLTAVSLAVAGFAGSALAGSAGALAASGPSTARAQPAIAQSDRLRAEIKLLDPYVVTKADGMLALSVPAAVARKVNPGDLQGLRGGLAVVNQKIAAGELVTRPGHRLVDPKDVTFNIQAGWTGKVWNWWGMEYYFNSQDTSKLEGLYNMGAALGTLCAIIAGMFAQPEISLLCGIAAAILWFGAGWLQWADNGSGDVIAETWTSFPTGGIWIWGQ